MPKNTVAPSVRRPSGVGPASVRGYKNNFLNFKSVLRALKKIKFPDAISEGSFPSFPRAFWRLIAKTRVGKNIQNLGHFFQNY